MKQFYKENRFEILVVITGIVITFVPIIVNYIYRQ